MKDQQGKFAATESELKCHFGEPQKAAFCREEKRVKTRRNNRGLERQREGKISFGIQFSDENGEISKSILNAISMSEL